MFASQCLPSTGHTLFGSREWRSMGQPSPPHPLYLPTNKYIIFYLLSNQQGENYWFVPNAPLLSREEDLRSAMKGLLQVMEQRADLQYLEASETVTVLRTLFDTLINDSCVYVSNALTCMTKCYIPWSCSHLHDIVLYTYHEAASVYDPGLILQSHNTMNHLM